MRERGGLSAFTRDAVAVLDGLAARRRPDVAGALARARELALAGESGLEDFTTALRAELDAKVHGRSLAGIPPLARPRRRAAIGVLLAVAAALVLVVAASGLVTRAARVGVAQGHAAGATVVPGAGAVVVEERRAPAAPVVAPVLEVRREPAPVAEVIEARPREASRTRRVSPASGPGVAVGGLPGVGVASLEDEAQALWQQGELAAAEQKLREVLRVAGATRRAELAYGDLFALVRQMRGADGQAAVWREYLGVFPGGQYADDVRAGLCRRAAGDEQVACWREYLGRHPAGAHRQQAEQVADPAQ